MFTERSTKPINLFNIKTDTNILTYIVRKDNTVIYNKIDTKYLRGHEPGLEVKLKISKGKMDIVNIKTSEIIASHSISEKEN